MADTSKKTKRVDVPDEPGHWLEIRMLSYLTLDKSRKEKLREAVELSTLYPVLKDVTAEQGAAAQAAFASDPMRGHHVQTLLKNGVVAWSYDGEVNVDELDERTAKWAAREVFRYSVPDEAEKKDSASGSTAS